MICLLLLVLFSFTLSPLSAAADNFYSWVQVVGNNQLSIRSVSSADKCPMLEVNGAEVSMSVRATPDPRFNNTVCEFLAPINSTSIFLYNKDMPVLKPKLTSIGLIGDSGCRQNALTKQNCSTEWHFKEVVSSLVKTNPDLVIHVGDYLYREGLCAGNICPGAPGDKDFVWEADALEPMVEAFNKSVFVFLRGNHENCSRGYRGWFRYFYNGSYKERCMSFSNLWFMDTNDKRFYFMDTSNESDMPDPTSQKHWLNQVSTIANDHEKGQGGDKRWLFSHVPFLLSIGNGETYFTPIGSAMNARKLTQHFSTVFSGHIHIGQFTKVESNGIPLTQVISGNSGALLDEISKVRYGKFELVSQKNVEGSKFIDGYGFAIISLISNEIAFKSKDGTTVSTHPIN